MRRFDWFPALTAPLFVASLLAACDGGAGPTLQTIEPQTLRVSESHTVTIGIDNPDGRPVNVTVEAPDLPSFDRVTTLTNDPGSATFRWVPLSSQTGTHELTFVLSEPGGGEYDRKSALFEVLASDDAAPVFVRPGAGGTYDLARDPCVMFDVEVRDDDTMRVEIGAMGELPDRATLANEGDKRAVFDWCPTPDQAGASERWTVRLFADDGEHPPVEHDYVIVLRTGPGREGCPGEAPAVTVSAPLMGERITSGTTYPVEVTVTDDLGLRDPPLLYYSLTEPSDPSDPDVTQFEQATFEAAGGDQYVARIPPLGLEEGEDAEVFFLVSATDNDDPEGSGCDHRTDTEVISFFAVGGTPPDGSLADCEYCTASSECQSGICASTATGGRCVQACAEADCATGTCGATATTEGGVRAGCGPVSESCGAGTGTCTDDGREEDDSTATATPYAGPYTDGQICAGDADYFSFSVARGDRVTVTVSDAVFADGDLDLTLQDGGGTIVATSAGVSATEEVSYCNAGSPGTFYARVFGYGGGDENSYSLSASVTPDPGMCCIDDGAEDDDTQATAQTPTFDPTTNDALVTGQICAGDDDYIAVPMAGPGTIEALLTFIDADGDLDMRLYGPGGAQLASSLSATDDESITQDVASAGTYALRISGFSGASNAYELLVIRTEGTSCSTTTDCPLDNVCDAGSCESDGCTSTADCPSMHSCDSTGPIPARLVCAADCAVNGDCRSGEACKWGVDGRGCGRTGSGQNGDACASWSSCGGQRTCVSWPGGYCARYGCSTNADCEADTRCVDVGGERVCAVRCVSAPCRSGYSCDFLPNFGDTDRFVCVPD